MLRFTRGFSPFFSERLGDGLTHGKHLLSVIVGLHGGLDPCLEATVLDGISLMVNQSVNIGKELEPAQPFLGRHGFQMLHHPPQQRAELAGLGLALLHQP